jgi:HK97 family phage major capsid protein
MNHFTYASAVKAIDDYIARGKAIVYDVRDADSEIFTKSTDLGGARSFVGMPVMYDHAMTSVKGQIGVVKSWTPSDDGIDVEIEIDRHLNYADKIMHMVKMGIIGLSTGALPHTVIRDTATGEIKRWHVGELSLTPRPASPHTIFTVKHMTDDEVRTAASRNGLKDIADFLSEDDMDTQLQDFATDVATKAAKAALDAYTKAAPGDVVPGGTAMPETKSATKSLPAEPASDPYASNQYRQVYGRYVKGMVDNGDLDVIANVKADYNRINGIKSLTEGVSNDGGITVPTGINREIILKRDQLSLLSQFKFRRALVDSWKHIIPAQGTKGATGVKTENGSATASTTNLSNSRTVQLYNNSYEWIMSDEVRDDTASDLEQMIQEDTARAMSVSADAYIVTNANSTGLLNRVTQSVTLGATSITNAQINSLATGIKGQYIKKGETGWLFQNGMWGALRTLDQTNYNRITDWQGDVRYVESMPVGLSDDMGTPLTTAQKSILFGNFYFAVFAERRSGVSIERWRDTRTQTTYITATWRYGFDVIQPEAFVYGVHA